MSRSCAVFYSPGAKATVPKLKKLFQTYGLEAQFFPVAECQRRASGLAVDVLVAAGGDGTVNCVASEGYRLSKPLAVIPLGTLNHFARDMGLPLTLPEAVEVVAQGRTEVVDLATVNDLVFLNNSSIGLYTNIVRVRERLERSVGKWPAALVALTTVLYRRAHLYDVRLTLDDQSFHCKTSLLFVGNNYYRLNSFGLPSRDTLWDGKLQLYVLKTKRIDRLVITAFCSVTGKKPPEKYLTRYAGTKLQVTLTNRPKAWVSHDGEISQCTTPLSYTLHAKAVTVYTPLSSRASV